MSQESAGHPRAYTCVKDMQKKIDAYLNSKDTIKVGKETHAKPKHMAGLAVALGVSKDTLCVYASGEYDDENNKYSEAIGEAKTHIESSKWDNALLGVYNATIAKFDLINNHDCKDKIEQTGEQTLHVPQLTINTTQPTEPIKHSGS